MLNLLSFESPLEFLLRYTVIVGMLLAIAGVVIILLAKHITMRKRGTEVLDKSDKLYLTLLFVGFGLVLVGMIVMALPISATIYKG